VIVAGDFNTSIYDKRFKDESTLRGFFEAGYSNAFEGMSERKTYTLPANAYYPPATFDYILHRGFSAQHQTRVQPERWVSDHRMVTVRLVP
jgi:endonuclease/exonuclease/phosphatase (EEP) superfamily protein YafD